MQFRGEGIWSLLFPVLFLHKVGPQTGNGLHDPVERAAHFRLELPVFAVPLLELPLDQAEPRLMAGHADTELGALPVEIRAQADIAADDAAADRAEHDERLHQVSKRDVRSEIRLDHLCCRMVLK